MWNTICTLKYGAVYFCVFLVRMTILSSRFRDFIKGQRVFKGQLHASWTGAFFTNIWAEDRCAVKIILRIWFYFVLVFSLLWILYNIIICSYQSKFGLFVANKCFITYPRGNNEGSRFNLNNKYNKLMLEFLNFPLVRC